MRCVCVHVWKFTISYRLNVPNRNVQMAATHTHGRNHITGFSVQIEIMLIRFHFNEPDGRHMSTKQTIRNLRSFHFFPLCIFSFAKQLFSFLTFKWDGRRGMKYLIAFMFHEHYIYAHTYSSLSHIHMHLHLHMHKYL